MKISCGVANWIVSAGLGLTACSDSSRFSVLGEKDLRPARAPEAVTDVLAPTTLEQSNEKAVVAQSTENADSVEKAAGGATNSQQVSGVVQTVSGGLKGGHFDLDTSSFSSEEEDLEHTHEFDDKHNVTGVDFFSIAESNQYEIDEVIAPTRRFVLVIVNASLSSSAVLNINGSDIPVVKYATDFLAAMGSSAPRVYTLGTPTTAGDVQLTRFSINFAEDAIANGGLISLEPSAVKANRAGPNGEYRAGALTIQAVAAEGFSIASPTGAASSESQILWESRIYWHK